jgi:hypothetical protein
LILLFLKYNSGLFQPGIPTFLKKFVSLIQP